MNSSSRFAQRLLATLRAHDRRIEEWAGRVDHLDLFPKLEEETREVLAKMDEPAEVAPELIDVFNTTVALLRGYGFTVSATCALGVIKFDARASAGKQVGNAFFETAVAVALDNGARHYIAELHDEDCEA